MHKLTFAALLLIACAPLALAQGTYTQIDYPHAFYGTRCTGIDSRGDIIGGYTDAQYNTYGFLLRDGVFTTIHDHTAQFTDLYGINDEGMIAGQGVNPDSGFIYDIATATFTNLRYPGSYSTAPQALNNSGVVAGGVTTLSGQAFGFELRNSKYEKIIPPGDSNANIVAITASNELVGTVTNSLGEVVLNFEFSGGRYRTISIPAPNATVTGISPSGKALVGYYLPAESVVFGFVYQDGVLTSLQFPGGLNTFAYGINDRGVVVGSFFDAQGDEHGFTWTPPAAEEKK